MNNQDFHLVFVLRWFIDFWKFLEPEFLTFEKNDPIYAWKTNFQDTKAGH